MSLIEDKIKIINDKIRVNQIKSKFTMINNKNTFNISRIKEKYHTDSKISLLTTNYSLHSTTHKANPNIIIQSILSKYKSSSEMLIKSHESAYKAKPQLNSIIALNKNMLIESTEEQFPSVFKERGKTLSFEHQNDFVYTVQSHQNKLVQPNQPKQSFTGSSSNHFIENLLTTHENYEIIHTEIGKKRRLTDYSFSPLNGNGKKTSNTIISNNKDQDQRSITMTSTKSVESFDGVYPIRRRIAFMQKEKKVITDRLSPIKHKNIVEKDEIFNWIKEYVDQNSNKHKAILMKKPLLKNKVPILIQRTSFIKNP